MIFPQARSVTESDAQRIDASRKEGQGARAAGLTSPEKSLPSPGGSAARRGSPTPTRARSSRLFAAICGLAVASALTGMAVNAAETVETPAVFALGIGL